MSLVILDFQVTTFCSSLMSGDASLPLEYFDSICPPERVIILVVGRPKKSVVYSGIYNIDFPCII